MLLSSHPEVSLYNSEPPLRSRWSRPCFLVLRTYAGLELRQKGRVVVLASQLRWAWTVPGKLRGPSAVDSWRCASSPWTEVLTLRPGHEYPVQVFTPAFGLVLPESSEVACSFPRAPALGKAALCHALWPLFSEASRPVLPQTFLSPVLFLWPELDYLLPSGLLFWVSRDCFRN